MSCRPHREASILEDGALPAGFDGLAGNQCLLCETMPETAGWTLHAGAMSARFAWDGALGVTLRSLRAPRATLELRPTDLWRLLLCELPSGRLIELGPSAAHLVRVVPPVRRGRAAGWHLRWEGMRVDPATTIDVVQTWQTHSEHPGRLRVTLRVLFGPGRTEMALVGMAPLRLALAPPVAADELYLVALGDGALVRDPRSVGTDTSILSPPLCPDPITDPANEQRPPSPEPLTGLRYPGDLSMMLRGFGSAARGDLLLLHGEADGRPQIVRDRAEGEAWLFESFVAGENTDRPANDHIPHVCPPQWIVLGTADRTSLTLQAVRSLRSWLASHARIAPPATTDPPSARRDGPPGLEPCSGPPIERCDGSPRAWWHPRVPDGPPSLAWLAAGADRMRKDLGLDRDAPLGVSLPPVPRPGSAKRDLVDRLRDDHMLRVVMERATPRPEERESRVRPGDAGEAPTADALCDDLLQDAGLLADSDHRVVLPHRGVHDARRLGPTARPIALFGEIARGRLSVVCPPPESSAEPRHPASSIRARLARAFLAGEVPGLIGDETEIAGSFARTILTARRDWSAFLRDGSPLPLPIVHAIDPRPALDQPPIRLFQAPPATLGPAAMMIGLVAVNAALERPLHIDLEIDLPVPRDARQTLHERRLFAGAGGDWSETRLPPVPVSFRQVLSIPPGGVILLRLVAHTDT